MLGVQPFSHVQPFAAPWNVTCLVPLLWKFPGEIPEWGSISYSTWSSESGIEFVSPELAGRFIPLMPAWKPV